MSEFEERHARLEESISAACHAAGRQREDVELMAVSKNHPASAILEAASLGLYVFGENRVQEFTSKSVDLSLASIPGAAMPARQAVRVHLIGHLQSNKATKAAEVFDAVDSVDSLKLAERLNEAAAKLGKKLPVLIEIKLSTEETKAGLAPDSPELSELLEKLPDLANLETEGLMTIAPLDVREDETRACFRHLRQLCDRLAATYPRLNFPVLSMGMSGDYALAIAEGATRIRVGTALFGTRPGYQK
ncbi:YggS family pyridoxal phosphate-dependent enzyme [Acidicapsa dinghuensis]|uniref:Pyridoxal phosphate homeostasis protein n=1 Tax=Acidicapsa dinghuensis TaxID=2218256 RepID=A0ABW1EFH4_9BACT|nr:YggS family pyridoxal phosphate-dependent enzyme [Acidicapsa dinghuensis]